MTPERRLRFWEIWAFVRAEVRGQGSSERRQLAEHFLANFVPLFVGFVTVDVKGSEHE